MSDTKDTKKTEAPKAEEVKEEKVETPVEEKAEKKAEAPKAKAPEKKVDTSLEDAEMAQELLESSVSEANVRSGGAGGRLTIREALMEYFSPTDLVTIKNPFDFNTGWVYSDPKDIKIEQPSAETRRVYGVGRDYAKTRILRAGQDITIPGWEAYVGITRFYKQWCQQSYRGGVEASMNNPAVFKKFMSMVYDGIFDPNKGKDTEIDRDAAARAALERDLGLAE